MRTDNSRHVIAAARRRAEQTRQRAVTTLRRMDATGQRISSVRNTLNLWKGEAAKAKTAEARFEVWSGLDEVLKQIAGR